MLHAICRGSVALLDVSGAAVILMSDEEQGAVPAALGRAADIADLEFALGEGPCREAFRGGDPVHAPDLSNRSAERWPVFARHALAVGARAVFVVPLQLGGVRVGVLCLDRNRPGMLSTDQLSDTFGLAELTTLTVLALQSQAPPGRLAAGLQGDWARRATVHQAIGVLVARLNIQPADALARLRAHAFANDEPIDDVAAGVVAGRLHLR
jgi:hypothetical protein